MFSLALSLYHVFLALCFPSPEAFSLVRVVPDTAFEDLELGLALWQARRIVDFAYAGATFPLAQRKPSLASVADNVAADRFHLRAHEGSRSCVRSGHDLIR